MARISATTHIEAPPERVWAVLTDWEGQVAWMVDAHAVEVVSATRAGVGTTVRCVTDLGLGRMVRITDELEVVDAQEPQSLVVRHLGPIIRGVGAFELTRTVHGTRLEWWEEAEAPLGPVGEAAAMVLVVPHVRRLFRRSLVRLKRVCEAAAVRPEPGPRG